MTRVLLVDDDAAVTAPNRTALMAAGFDVEVATSTTEALGAIGHAAPDLVVLEGLLDGGWAGFDLARSLSSTHPGLPLVMLTRADDELTPPARATQDHDGGWLPVDRFLEKPVAPEVLAAEVGQLLHEMAADR
jgi:DNA-binding response OmpR family regulator